MLVDYPAYRRWTGFMSGISAELGVGDTLKVILSPSSGGSTPLRPKLIVMEAEHELRWSGRDGSLPNFLG